MRARLAIGLVAACAVALGACTRAEERGAETNSTTLTIYLSLPFQGAAGPESQATADGARLALARAGGRAGEFVVKLSVLDDARTGSERWDPDQTAENANTAVRDRTTIAYLGDGPSGATAISLPILNAAGIVQISPSSGYAGLTQAQGADKGEPEKYYPAGVRSFARTLPSDARQLTALLELVREEGCRRVQLLDDGDIDGRGLTQGLARELEPEGAPEVVDQKSLRPENDVDPASEAREVVARRPDCAVLASAPTRRFTDLADALHAADPALVLIATDGLATPEVAERLAAGTGRALRLTAPGGTRSAKGRRIAAAYQETFGRPARTSSLHGYDAMELALAAIRTAGPRGNNREAVERALFAVGDRVGPFGRVRLTRGGDLTAASSAPEGEQYTGTYVVQTVRDGRLVPVAGAGERERAGG